MATHWRKIELNLADYVEDKYPKDRDLMLFANGLRHMWSKLKVDEEDIYKAIECFEESNLIHAKLMIYKCYKSIEDEENFLLALENFRKFDKKCEFIFHYYYGISKYKNIYDDERIKLVKKSADLGLFQAKRMMIITDKRPFKKIRLLKNAIAFGCVSVFDKLDLRLL